MTRIPDSYHFGTSKQIAVRLPDEVRVGARNGLSQDSVVACDHITTIPVSALGEQIGLPLDDQEPKLAAATKAALDLD